MVLLPLAKGHLSNVTTISWHIRMALLERDYCINKIYDDFGVKTKVTQKAIRNKVFQQQLTYLQSINAYPGLAHKVS